MRHHDRLKTAIACLSCSALVLATTRGNAAEESAEKIISKSFTVEPGGTVTLDVDQGDVELVTGKQNAVEVVAERTVAGRSESQTARILKNHKVAIVLEGNNVHVEAKSAKASRQPDLRVHFRVAVPARFDARLDTAGGGIQVTGLQGGLDAHTAGGDLNFTNIHGLVNGQSDGGNIRVIGCSDKTQVRTSGGNIFISDFSGPAIQADSSGGNITVKGCSGGLAIKTSGGNIEVENFTGPAAFGDTAGGSIAFDLASAPLSDSSFRTGGGNITVKLAQTVALKLNAVTQGGKITTAIPVTMNVKGEIQEGLLDGTINDGGPKLQLRTSGGNIEILKR